MNIKIKPETIKEMEELRSKGLTYRAIAKQLDLNERTVARTILNTIPSHKRYSATPECIATMRKLKEQGWTRDQIAYEMGCAPSTVSKHLAGYMSNRQGYGNNVVKENNLGMPDTQINWTWADWQKYWGKSKSKTQKI